jgi:hypothetical protein
MSVAVGPLLDSVSVTLLDTARRTWELHELVGYLNEFMAATANIKPDMYTRQEFVTPVAGISQIIPTDGVALLDIIQNASGKVITQVDAGLLDEANRFWPAATQTSIVEHFAADPRDPRRFNVTPPNDGTGSIQVLYGAVPPDATGSSAEDLPIAPSYLAPAINYVLGKCYAKTSKRQDLVKAQAYMSQWAASIGMKSKAQVAVAPKVAVSEGNA